MAVAEPKSLPGRSADQLAVVARANEIIRERGSFWGSNAEPLTLNQAEAMMRALAEYGWIPRETP